MSENIKQGMPLISDEMRAVIDERVEQLRKEHAQRECSPRPSRLSRPERTESERASYVEATLIEPNQRAKKQNTIGLLAKKILGAVLILIGIPMLILPGPGIAVTGIGLLLLLGGKKRHTTT